MHMTYKEHQQDQIGNKMSRFKKSRLQHSVNENVLHNGSENLYYNYIRRLLHKIKQWKS